jgi:acid phosphatase type 7
LTGGVEKKIYSDTVNHPQVLWLKQDLATNPKKWTVVDLHFPPYTQGSHHSETEADLVAIRQNINLIVDCNRWPGMCAGCVCTQPGLRKSTLLA